MKYIFIFGSVILLALGLITYLSFPDSTTDVPVIYWVTDANPARIDQVSGFRDWLITEGYVNDQGEPVVRLELDSSNADTTKKIIQSVSGVAGDVMDLASGLQLQLFEAMGVTYDVTDDAARLGFGLDKTFAALEPELTIDGRQYMFPCNVSASMLWINKATFEKYGQPIPPERWTFEEFERMGKAFVEAANKDRRPGDRVFYVDNLNFIEMHRSLGLSIFNETLTACDLDDPRYVRTISLLKKWREVDRLIPSQDDKEAFDAAAGYGGLSAQLFNRGNYAMMRSGRYMLIQFRKFGQLELDCTEYPHGGFPVTTIITRAVAVYTGSKHRDLALLFPAYLASEDYSMQIVRDADALPPNPVVTSREAYLRPPDYPNEWGVHEKFLDAANNIAIGNAYSPYILATVVAKEMRWYLDQFDEDMIDAEYAARETARSINERIGDELKRNPKLQVKYDKAMALQKQIDAKLEAGEKIPASWVSNPFYRRYYEEQGMLVTELNKASNHANHSASETSETSMEKPLSVGTEAKGEVVQAVQVGEVSL